MTDNEQQTPENKHGGQQPHRGDGGKSAEGQMPLWVLPVMEKVETLFDRWQAKSEVEIEAHYGLMKWGNTCVFFICIFLLFFVGSAVAKGQSDWPVWTFASVSVSACVAAISHISRQVRKEGEHRLTEKDRAPEKTDE